MVHMVYTPSHLLSPPPFSSPFSFPRQHFLKAIYGKRIVKNVRIINDCAVQYLRDDVGITG